MVPGIVAKFRTSINQLTAKQRKALIRKAGRDLAAAGQTQALTNLRMRAKTNGYAQGGNRAIMHVPTTPSNNKYVVQAPAAVGRRMQSEWSVSNGSRRGSIRVKGQDWLGRIVASASEVPGYVYLEIYINPLTITGSRLSLFAQLYDKFRFGLLKFHFVPSGSTQTRGSVILAYDRDISDATPPLGDGGIRQFLAMMDAVNSPIWAPCTAVCPLSHPEEGLWCNPVVGGDERLAFQGQLYVACMEPSSLTAGQAIGDLFMEYDVEFFDPQLDTTIPIAKSLASGTVMTLGPTANDILRPYAPGGQTTIVDSGLRTLIPKVGADLRAYVDAAQGVYRVINSLQQTQAGGVSFNAPTCEANVPKAVPAPQPIVYLGNNSVGNTVGDSATSDYFVAVPPGGGKIYQTGATTTGLDGLSAGQLTVEQLSPNWFDPASMFV